MKELRALLIDCRIELRKQSRDFQKSELCERLDLAIQANANAQAQAQAQEAQPGGEPADETTHNPAAQEKSQTVSQVALAWQTATRDLKFSDPAIYARLGEKVMRLLAAKTLVDPATEIIQLEQQAAELQKKVAAHEAVQKAAGIERDALLGALANAVPSLKDGGDRLAVALARVAWLKATAQKAAEAEANPSSVKRAPEPQDTIPSNELLAAVAAGAAELGKEHREWCVGEAMVLTSFQFTPVELIEKGDAHMARLIQQARLGG